jgi:nucleotide-binding universal stress UspA family protein
MVESMWPGPTGRRKEETVTKPRHILVPTDFSDASEAAKRQAVVLADALGATLHVLHVIPDPLAMGWGVEAAYLPRMLEHAERDVHEKFASFLTRDGAAKLEARVAVEVGSPAAAILAYAATHGVDMIVMGTHGRGAVEKLWVGSVTERVLRSAKCPVLSVRQ